jgi:hypothetical protein
VIVFVCIFVVIYSLIQWLWQYKNAADISRETGRPYDECLATIKGVDVKQLREDRWMWVFALVFGTIVAILGHL